MEGEVSISEWDNNTIVRVNSLGDFRYKYL
jgi:hypothetical protein